MINKELYIGEMIVRMLQCENELSLRKLLAFTQHFLADSNSEVIPTDVSPQHLRQITQTAKIILEVNDVLKAIECILISHEVQSRGVLLEIIKNALLIKSEKAMELLSLHSSTLTKY